MTEGAGIEAKVEIVLQFFALAILESCKSNLLFNRSNDICYQLVKVGRKLTVLGNQIANILDSYIDQSLDTIAIIVANHILEEIFGALNEIVIVGCQSRNSGNTFESGFGFAQTNVHIILCSRIQFGKDILCFTGYNLLPIEIGCIVAVGNSNLVLLCGFCILEIYFDFGFGFQLNVNVMSCTNLWGFGAYFSCQNDIFCSKRNIARSKGDAKVIGDFFTVPLYKTETVIDNADSYLEGGVVIQRNRNREFVVRDYFVPYKDFNSNCGSCGKSGDGIEYNVVLFDDPICVERNGAALFAINVPGCANTVAVLIDILCSATVGSAPVTAKGITDSLRQYKTLGNNKCLVILHVFDLGGEAFATALSIENDRVIFSCPMCL